MLLAVFGEAELMTVWDYDARLAENFQSTFGALVTKFAELAGPRHVRLTEQLKKAVDDRNDLAHQYFWDRVSQFCSSDGRAQMITELNWITAVRLKVEENQLVGIFGEIGVPVDGLKGA